MACCDGLLIIHSVSSGAPPAAARSYVARGAQFCVGPEGGTPSHTMARKRAEACRCLSWPQVLENIIELCDLYRDRDRSKCWDPGKSSIETEEAVPCLPELASVPACSWRNTNRTFRARGS